MAASGWLFAGIDRAGSEAAALGPGLQVKPSGGVAMASRRSIHTTPEVSMKKFLAALIGLFILAGCNTMAGIGEDTQAAGKKLENSAEKNKNYHP